MKFTAEELYEIAREVYRKHGVDMTYNITEGVGNWAANSEGDDYRGGKVDVIDELEGYDFQCPECGEDVRLAEVVDGQCPECREEYEDDEE